MIASASPAARNHGDYDEFLSSKRIRIEPYPVKVAGGLHPILFSFQAAIVERALQLGRMAIFSDCGTGKTLMQLEWAHFVAQHTAKPVLILTPLAVAEQTRAECTKLRYDAVVAESQEGVRDGITITNYQKLHKFDPRAFGGIVLDESSILKSYDGKFRNRIIDSFAETEFKLACTATPSPNDHMELGNHAEFLGVTTRTEMLANFFVHDGGETQSWRLKGHAVDDFWKWVCSWSVMMRKPSDIGFQDAGFDLPELRIEHYQVETDQEAESHELFAMPASSLQERRRARKGSLPKRVVSVSNLVNGNSEQWLVWCDRNDESTELAKSLDGVVEIRGSTPDPEQVDAMVGFAEGRHRVLTTKPSIAGFGMNWQNCHNVVFCGLSDSYEQFYQSVRRCWRFGQKENVNVYVVTSTLEDAVIQNIRRKQADNDLMAESMIEHMPKLNTEVKRAIHND
jgi:superfamily II DNA or RNA helicase